MASNDYDVLIVGAGLVGSSLAIGLAKTSLRIALCEASLLKTASDQATHSRFLAVTYGSAQFLQHLGVWLNIVPAAAPIHTVHVSHRGHLGITRISAAAEGVSALGYVIPASLLGAELNKAVLNVADLTLFNPASVHALTKTATGWQVEIETEGKRKNVTASLVIAADGSQSLLRQLLDIATETHEYDQSAIVASIVLSRAHQYIAYERFTEEGAIAILPLNGKCCALIWTASTAKAEALLKLTDAEFLQQVQQNFGYRLGRLLKVNGRHAYPLKFIAAKEQIRENFVLIGNAAHTLHPIAAQGFNLGLSDVKYLIKTITENKKLADYVQQSQSNQQRIMRFTNRLVTGFAYNFLPVNMLRSGSLIALDLISPLKHTLAKQLMGIN